MGFTHISCLGKMITPAKLPGDFGLRAAWPPDYELVDKMGPTKTRQAGLEASYQEVARRIHRCQEVILTLDNHPPGWLISSLSQAARGKTLVKVLFEQFSDVDFLEKLHRLNFNLFEAIIPKTGLLFLDREMGYRLPSLQPLDKPFSLACRMLWARIGQMIEVQGLVVEREREIIQLKLADDFSLWLSLKGVKAGAVKPGARVKVFGISSFFASRTNPVITPLKITSC